MSIFGVFSVKDYESLINLEIIRQLLIQENAKVILAKIQSHNGLSSCLPPDEPDMHGIVL